MLICCVCGNQGTEGDREKPGTFKSQKEADKKAAAGNRASWNTLYARPDTVVAAVAEHYGISREELLDRDAPGLLPKCSWHPQTWPCFWQDMSKHVTHDQQACWGCILKGTMSHVKCSTSNLAVGQPYLLHFRPKNIHLHTEFKTKGRWHVHCLSLLATPHYLSRRRGAKCWGIESTYHVPVTDVAVRVALGEAHVLALTKRALEEAGVSVDALEQAAAASGKASLGKSAPRSSNVLLVKNLPYSAAHEDLQACICCMP